MNWKRVVSHLLAVLTGCIITIAVFVLPAKFAGDYMAKQTKEFRDLVGAEVLRAKDPPLPKVRKPGTIVESETRNIIDVTSLNEEQRARLDKFMDELIEEQIAE